MPTVSPNIFDLKSRLFPGDDKADITHTYQGIYVATPGSTQQTYNASTQLPVSPKDFKKFIWNADFQVPYGKFLDTFWRSHEKNYPALTKASFIKAALAQHQEGSLTAQGRQLVMRAAGLPGHQESWPDIKLEDLLKKPAKDPGLSTSLLKIGEYQSTDIMVISDHTSTTDANAKTSSPTLLYIPGNSSPLHSFNSQDEMKVWLAAQMADTTKRDALVKHFALKDKPDGWARAGVDETLAGLGAWPDRRETPGGVFSYNHRAFSGKWPPHEYITTTPSNDPFQDITDRQKQRSYADAAVEITSDSDVTKSRITDTLEKAEKIALFLTPLALVMPEVAVALDAFYVIDGLTKIGIGADDKRQGKPKANDRIIFGALNAVPVLAPRLQSLAGTTVKTEKQIGTVLGEEAKPVSAARPRSLFPEAETEVLGTPPRKVAVPTPLRETAAKDGKLITLSGNMEHLNKIDDKLYTFIDNNKKGAEVRLNIVVHGDGTHVYFEGARQTPEGLLNTLRLNNIDPSDFDNIRLLSCHSGDLGEDSFAAKFQRLVGRPVKGYVGTVTTYYSPEELKDYFKIGYKSKSNASEAERMVQNFFANNKEFTAEKTNPYNPLRNPHKWWTYTYQPAHFPAKT